MINLFNINNHIIDTSKYSNLLHGGVVTEFENAIADYVGAKYAVSFSSATNAIFLALRGKNTTITVPSMIPPVVLNAIITSGNIHSFRDDTNWVGDSYTLHDFGDYKIIDSAQQIYKDQFIVEANRDDLMVFSHYPTKPIGSCDGGMIVSNDLNKITELRELALNGMSYSANNWEREIKNPGFKMYMNSIQAEIGLNNLNVYETKLARLAEIREMYNKAFGLKNTSNHLYRINVFHRHILMDALRYNDINTGIHYEATHTHPVYTIIEDDIQCPKTDFDAKHTLSIPFHEKLTDKEVQYIINTIKSKDCLL